MSKAAMNLQDSFLNQVRRENTEVHVLLVNGKSLRGIVKGFDNFTLILSSRNGQHLVYKHAIAQVVSARFSAKREGDETVKEELADVEPGDSPPKNETAQQKARREGFNQMNFPKLKVSSEPETL
jgi:host factor-I protein